MFNSNEFFTNVKKNENGTKVEVKLPKAESTTLFGIISVISSIIDFCIMFGGYFILNFAKEVTDRPFHNIKLMVYTAIVLFSLSSVIFGIIGIANFFKKEKHGTFVTISLILSVLGLIFALATAIMSYIFFFV